MTYGCDSRYVEFTIKEDRKLQYRGGTSVVSGAEFRVDFVKGIHPPPLSFQPAV